MDNYILSPSSSSSVVSFPTTNTPDNLQQKLQHLLQIQPQPWAYAIFWQTVTDYSNGCVSLSWGDGHFHRNHHHLPPPTTLPPPLREIHTLVGPDNTERYYLISLTKSFTPGDGSLPGTAFGSNAMIWLSGVDELRTFNCERAKEARIHGFETLVCIPIPNGIVEMGSYHVIKESWSLSRHALSIFGGGFPSFFPHKHHENTDTTYRPLKLNKLNDGDHNHHHNLNSFADLVLMSCGSQEEGVNMIDYESTTHDYHISKNAGIETALEHSDSNCQLVLPTTERQTQKIKGKKTNGPDHKVNHVEAERQRRQKLNQCFYALRSVVPKVSRMDKVSLLEDAVCYINELKKNVQSLESQLHRDNNYHGKTKKMKAEMADTMDNNQQNCSSQLIQSNTSGFGKVKVKMVGEDAMIRVQSRNADLPAAKLMDALRDMKAEIQHASMSCVNEIMLQDLVVRIPGAIDEDELKSELIRRLDS